MATTDFFEEPQGAAVFKHAVFRRYVPVFAGKTGSTVWGNRVVVADCYAGPGRYEDGSPGSPVITAEIARTLADKTGRQVDLICVERDRPTCDRLEKELAPFAINSAVLAGSLEDHIDEVLRFAGDSPLLAFLDPFGMGAPMDQLRRFIERDPNVGGPRVGTPTEILMNFSLSALWRNAGMLTTKSTNATVLKAAATTVRRMDSWLGDDWWHEVWMRIVDTEGDARIHGYREIVFTYCRKLSSSRAWHVTPASDRWGGRAAYLLGLFTNSEHGLWYFNDALSKARRDHYDFCHRDRLALDPFPGWEREWTSHIAGNLERLIANGPVRIGGSVSEILGDYLGWARERHIRAAIKELHSKGKTRTPGKGPLLGSVVDPP